MRPADMDDNQLASTIRPLTVRPGELASEQTAQPTVRARRRGRTTSHEVWSPQTTSPTPRGRGPRSC
jgi:hypothetical protein